MVESLLTTQVFLGFQHYIVFNSYNLVRVPRRLRSPCPSHRSRTAQRFQVPRPALSEFLQLGFTKHPFQRTIPLRLHEDLREAQLPSNTGNTMPMPLRSSLLPSS